MNTISGEATKSHGIGTVKVHTDTRNSADIEALVVHKRPLDFDLLLGYDVIKALDDVLITQSRTVKFCEEAPICAALKIDQPDLNVKFNRQKVWTTSWKWLGESELAKLQNSIAENHMPGQTRSAYEKELRAWIDAGWLIPYPHKKLGPPKSLIPLMAVVQQSKSKVRSVMDYRELNQYVDTFMADADVCASKLQEWCQHGPNVSLLDLRRAYLQVRVSESLWPFQTVMFASKRYCLARLSSGLNVAPQVMKTIINAVLSQEEKVKEGTPAYLDDIYVNEDIMSSLHVKVKLAQFGLICKNPERLEDGACVLGLDVHQHFQKYLMP